MARRNAAATRADLVEDNPACQAVRFKNDLIPREISASHDQMFQIGVWNKAHHLHFRSSGVTVIATFVSVSGD
jgi:hypothetical protein